MTKEQIYFSSREFEEKYYYDGKLGSFCSDRGTVFLLWAPTANRIVLHLYRTGHETEVPRNETMRPYIKGVWRFETPENLDGIYYDYDVTVGGETRRTADPYAKACGVNGNRSMVIDLTQTNPLGWDWDFVPERPKENIIYEVHVKDFSWDVDSGISTEKRGKYLGLCERGTTLKNDGIHATGIDYLRDLGVTHIQLMPVYDYGSVDEAAPDQQYNWGYDPVNYNVPEGSYASDPYNGKVRIYEFKQMVKCLHENGFRVIMDVVYNHTYHLDSWLGRTVPGYYYRMNEDGTPSNGSGCGNDTASERKMCGKYILDSVLYWAEEYHIDGFRFDLMGLLPVNLMNDIRNALDLRFGKGEKLLYGEPWRATATAVSEDIKLADKSNLLSLDDGVGAFCDATRDAVKGGLLQKDARGFVNGGGYSHHLMKGCLKGWAGISGDYSVKVPKQTIGYLSCHDDWTLWDRLVYTLDETRAYTGDHPKCMQANRLAAAILMGCQGNIFLYAGEEFGRTKYGIKNSYRSPIEVNKIDWTRAWKNWELKDYYRGLFALRKQIFCLTNKDAEAGDAIKNVSQPANACACVDLQDLHPDSHWKQVRLLYNLSNKVQKITLGTEIWQILADDRSSFRWKQSAYIKDQAWISPMSAMILGR